MKSKPRKGIRKQPFITYMECKIVEITDPAEKAELDRRCEEAEKYMVDGYWDGKKPKNRKKKRRPA